jgi:hypothetical protein
MSRWRLARGVSQRRYGEVAGLSVRPAQGGAGDNPLYHPVNVSACGYHPGMPDDQETAQGGELELVPPAGRPVQADGERNHR